MATLLNEIGSLLGIGITGVYFGLFLLPGFLITFHIYSRKPIFNRSLFVLISLFFSYCIAYIVFWCYFLSRIAGIISSHIVLATSIIFLILALQQKKKEIADIIMMPDFYIPLFLTALAAIFYTALLSTLSMNLNFPTMSNFRFLHTGYPRDNWISFFFMNRLFHGEDLTTPFAGDWYLSDRPPMLAAATLLLAPIKLFKLSYYYQIFSTFLQSTWIMGVWFLCRRFRLQAQTRWFILGMMIFSGFFVHNSVFVWPKIMTIPLLSLAFILLIDKMNTQEGSTIHYSSFFRIILGAASAAMAILSHGGAYFSLLAMGIILLIKPYRLKLRLILAGILVFSIFSTPWILFQKLYLPPGNRLIKMHLAGEGAHSYEPALKVIINAYASHTTKEIITYKVENLRTVFVSVPRIISSFVNEKYPDFEDFRIRKIRPPLRIQPPDTVLNNLRRNASFHTIFTLGVINILVLYAGILNLFFRTILAYFKKKMSPFPRNMLLPLVYFFLSILVWTVLMFRDTAVHNGSYMNIVMLFILFGTIVTAYTSKIVQYKIFFLNLLYFLVVYVFSKGAYTGEVKINIPACIASSLTGSFILYTLWSIKLRDKIEWIKAFLKRLLS